jgi:hypothetical protein
MSEKNALTHRLALLEGARLSPAELESVVSEIEDLEQIVAELEAFVHDTPWISQQTQPSEKKA